MRPDVSIVIPCFNCERWIAEAIESCLNQNGVVIEIIVVIDGGSDKSADIANSFGSSVRLVFQANKGVSAARNAGAKVTSGRYCKFLDADDLLPHNCLQKIVQFADRNGGSSLIGGYEQIDAQGNLLQKKGYDYPIWIDEAGFLNSEALITQATSVSLVLFSLSILKNGLKFDEDISLGEEYTFFLNFIKLGFDVLHINECLSIIRNHGGPRLSNTGDDIDFSKQLSSMVECAFFVKNLNSNYSNKCVLLLSQRIWVLGRDCLRKGSVNIANDCFSNATLLSGQLAISGKLTYQVLTKFFGPFFSERIVTFFKKQF